MMNNYQCRNVHNATYRIARNIGGVKLWRINEILHWRRKLWRITYFGDQVEMSGGRREMLAA